jgi:hypothetical protein
VGCILSECDGWNRPHEENKEIYMNEPIEVKALDWNLAQKLAGFVKDIVAGDKQTQDGNTPVESDDDVVFSPIDTVEEIKQFYPAIEKAVPLGNVAGENQGKLWVEGSFEKQQNKLAIGTWVSCRIGDTKIPVWVGISDEHPALYAWCPRKSAFGAGREGPKTDIGGWLYSCRDDAYWRPISEQRDDKRDLRKALKERLRDLCDKIQREWKQNPMKNSDDAPTRLKM